VLQIIILPTSKYSTDENLIQSVPADFNQYYMFKRFLNSTIIKIMV